MVGVVCAVELTQERLLMHVTYVPTLRCRNWELGAPWSGVQIQVPVKFIIGDQDMTYHFPGIKEYIHGGGFKRDVPMLEEAIVMEGVAHFINQEKAPEITDHICDFIRRF